MKLIEVNHLSKKIHGKDILKDISFTINDGECVALIGPNGAGKTTLMDCLLGDKFLTSGQASVRGLKPTDEQLQQMVAILPQENTVVEDLKVKELLNFFQNIYPNSLTNQEIDALLKFTDKQKEQLASKLSGGQKRLFSFILALIGRPKILFLDEPTTGMDLASIDNFWELLKDSSCTSVIVTHDFNQIDQFFSRVLILKNGYILADESVAEIHKTGKTIEQYYRDLSNLEEKHD